MVGLMCSMGAAGGSSLPRAPPSGALQNTLNGKGKSEELPNVSQLMPHCLLPTVLPVGV